MWAQHNSEYTWDDAEDMRLITESTHPILVHTLSVGWGTDTMQVVADVVSRSWCGIPFLRVESSNFVPAICSFVAQKRQNADSLADRAIVNLA